MMEDSDKLLGLKLDLLEAKIRLFAAASKNKGRWITTEKGQRVFIPAGADVKETVEKAIEKRKKSDKFLREENKRDSDELKNEREKTRKLLDKVLEKMDEKTLAKKLTEKIDSWENVSDDERKQALKRIRELLPQKPTYKGPEIPQWSKFNESLEREIKLRNEQRKEEGKPALSKKEKAALHIQLFEVWREKIESYEPKPKRRSPEIEKFEKELSELSKKKRGYMNDEEYSSVRYIEAVLQDKTPRAVELARKRIEKMDVSEEFKRKLRKRLDGS